MIGRKVLLVGRVGEIAGNMMQLMAADGGVVTVRVIGSFDSTLVEIEGTVLDERTVEETAHVDLGETFDINLYKELLCLCNDTYVDLFRPRV